VLIKNRKKMVEITDGLTDYELDALYGKEEKSQQTELSSTGYKTKVLMDQFFFYLGAGDFQAGRPLTGLLRIALSTASLFTAAGTVVVGYITLAQTANGEYKDGRGLAVRQVIKLDRDQISTTSHNATLAFSYFLGAVGAHQFYAGKPFKGVAMLCTLGGLGVWNLINIYEIATCQFKDGKGRVICPEYIQRDNGVNPHAVDRI
jgi:TM2 domain-containing membrane protein YozV